MPAQAVHLAYAQRLLSYRPQFDEGAFLRGSIFPDTRYLARAPRSQTHWPGRYQLADVLAEPDSWKAGVWFHSWADDQWNEYFSQYGLTDSTDGNSLTRSALKIMEDQPVRQHIRDLDRMLELLVQVGSHEGSEFGIEPRLVRQWNEAVDLQLTHGLASDSWRAFAVQELGLSWERIRVLRERINELEEASVRGERLAQCWDHIASAIDQLGADVSDTIHG